MHETAKQTSVSIVGDYSKNKISRTIPRWRQIEFWLPAVLVFAFCMMVSVQLGYAAGGGAEIYAERISSTAIRQVAFLGLGGVGFYLLTVTRPATHNQQIAWTILLPTLGVVCYIFASIAWTDDAMMTMKRAITATLLIVAGLGIGRVWRIQDYAWGIIICSSLFLAIGILVELRFRSFLSVSEYRFSGLFHPAKQAFSLGFLLVASLSIYFTQGRRWVLVIAALALAFLVMTKARTGTVAALVASAWLAWHYTSLRGWVVAGIACLSLGTASLMFYQGATGQGLDTTAITTMGRNEEAADPTKLTGRLPIWTHALDQFTAQPVLGYGYGAYWTMMRLTEFERLNGWSLYHSHSTYIEALLNFGMIGFLLGLSTLALAFQRSLQLRRQGDHSAVLVSAILVLCFIGGFFEIAFIALEYESIVPMIGIGLMVFAKAPRQEAVR